MTHNHQEVTKYVVLTSKGRQCDSVRQKSKDRKPPAGATLSEKKKKKKKKKTTSFSHEAYRDEGRERNFSVPFVK